MKMAFEYLAMARVRRKIGFCEDPKRMWKAVTLERGNAKNNPGTLAVKKPDIRISQPLGRISDTAH